MIRAKRKLRNQVIMRSKPVDLGPPRRLASRRWFWAIWALLCALLLAGSVVVLAERYKVSDERIFVGKFAPVGRTTELIVPAGVPMSQLLVGEGDQVVLGQRLARYDSEALSGRIDQVSLEILLNNTLQECLLNKSVLPDETIADMNLDASDRLAVQATLRECRLKHRKFGLDRDALQGRILSLRTRADLAVQTLVTDRELRQKMSAREIALRAAVERQKFESSIKPLELQLARMATDHEGQLLKQVLALREDADRLSQALTLLNKVLETPWLIAPESGRVQRLRPVAEHTVFSKDTEVMTLSGAEFMSLQASARVSSEHGGRFEKGDLVFVRLSGMPMTASRLQARVSDIFDTPGQLGSDSGTTISVELGLQDIDDPQLRRLVKRQMEIGDTGGSITFELGETSILETLVRSAESLMSAAWSS
jgi:multidrug efflux pump subunit AcrA (membrane-fusion protein)